MKFMRLIIALTLILCLPVPQLAMAAARPQSPPPLQLSAPDQVPNPDQTLTHSAAAPALPPLAAQNAPQSTDQSAPRTTAQNRTQTSGQGTPASVPLPDINIPWSGYFQALAVLCLALAALWALLWLLKRRGGLGAFMVAGGPVMRIESRLALGPKKWIIVVRYMGRRLVIGVSDQTMSLLTEFYDEEATDATADDGASAAPGKSASAGLAFAPLVFGDKKRPEADAD